MLQDDEKIARVIGIARRPFDPAEQGWTKMEYRRGDVRDPEALREAFAGADVVVHLAFLIISGNKETTQAINVEGTLNAFRAAAAAGAKRFVYASSIAAYGFHRDNPVGITEEWPTRPADALFYAQEKAELEQLLQDEAARHPEMELYLIRPPIVLGPDAVGAKAQLSPGLLQVIQLLHSGIRRLRVVPAVVPDLPMQLIHQNDVAEALRLCVIGAGPPGAYNIAADDIVNGADVLRELGIPAVDRSRQAHGGRRSRHLDAAVPALGPAVGGSAEPPGHHGHDESPYRARLAAEALGHRVPASKPPVGRSPPERRRRSSRLAQVLGLVSMASSTTLTASQACGAYRATSRFDFFLVIGRPRM